jgi:Papain-like cysteine protease AvrRpt2/LysM domain
MAIEKLPRVPLAQNFRPPGGTPYRVRNGDTWVSLAAQVHIDVWNLIEYNFHTRNPDEVNWYLRRNVGCRKTTPDGRNYTFSSDATPGIVYLPPPFGAPVSYTVPGVFNIIAQPSSMACWATVGTMMLSWRDQQSYPIGTAMAMCGAKWVGVFNANTGLALGDTIDFPRDAGMSVEPLVSTPPDTWEKMLRASGPLAIVTALPAFHARIMVGISGDGTPGGTTVDLIDPAGGTRYRQNFGVFNQSFEAVASSATRAQVWHF